MRHEKTPKKMTRIGGLAGVLFKAMDPLMMVVETTSYNP